MRVHPSILCGFGLLSTLAFSEAEANPSPAAALETYSQRASVLAAAPRGHAPDPGQSPLDARAAPTDVMLDQVYDRISAAYAAGDAALLLDAYAPDATVFPSAPNRPVVRGHEAIRTGPGGALTRASATGVRLSLAFEITERRKLGETAVDVGFYRLSERSPDGSCSIMVGKFLTVLARQSDGQWALIADTDTPMPATAWPRADSSLSDCAGA